MKYLLFTLIILTGVMFGGIEVEAVTGEDIRTDWSFGESVVVLDATSPCTDTAVARADWSFGESVIVIDATASCTAAAAADEIIKQDVFCFD